MDSLENETQFPPKGGRPNAAAASCAARTARVANNNKCGKPVPQKACGCTLVARVSMLSPCVSHPSGIAADSLPTFSVRRVSRTHQDVGVVPLSNFSSCAHGQDREPRCMVLPSSAWSSGPREQRLVLVLVFVLPLLIGSSSIVSFRPRRAHPLSSSS
jgi:hypothetical protein